MNKLFATKIWQSLWASLLLVLLTTSAAHAGQWELEGYFWSGKANSLDVFWSGNAQQGYQTPSYNQKNIARNETGDDEDGPPSYARVSTSGSRPWIETTPHKGILETSGEIGSSVYARFNWRRNTTGNYDEATGDYTEFPDPDDNPPSHVYVRETASVFAHTNIHHVDWWPYSDPTPWEDDHFQITGEAMDGLSVGQRVRTSVSSFKYNPGYKTVIRKIAVSGDTAVVPSRSFQGEIKLSPGYEKEGFDQITTANLYFGYDAGVADVNFSVAPSNIFRVVKDEPNEKEFDAFVSRGWRENEGDTPEDAARQYWSGGATYAASVRKSGSSESFFSSQIYNWKNEGEDSLFTGDTSVPNYDRQKNDISVSYPVKDLTHDFGEITAENLVSSAKSFPKSSTVSVEIKGDEGGDSIDSSGTINWHVPFATIFEVAISLEVELPEGETLDLSEVPDDEFGDSEEWEQVEQFTALRKGSPRLWLDATNTASKETFVFFATEAATRGIGRLGKPIFRALEARQASRGLQKPMSRFLSRNLLKFNANRAAKGKIAAKFKPKITVTNKGTVGTVDPRNIPQLPKWWVPVVPIGTDGDQNEGTTTVAPAPEDGGGSTTTVDTGSTVTTINGSTITTTREGSNGTGSTRTTGTTIVGEGEVGTTWVTPDPPTVPDGPNLRNPVWLWPATGTTSKGTDNANRPELEVEKEGSKDTITWDEEPKFKYYFYTSDPIGFMDDGADRWIKPDDGNPAWPSGYYFTTVPPTAARIKSQGEHSFQMFGHPYAFGGEVHAVQVEFDVPLPGFPSPHQGAVPLFWIDYGTQVAAGGGRVLSSEKISFLQQRAPSAEDVPDGDSQYTPTEQNTDPALRAQGFGVWDGAEGNSGWIPRGENARAVTGGQAVPFKRNYPDFSEWSVFSISLLPLQRGEQEKVSSWDFKQARLAFAANRNLRDANGNPVTSDAAIIRHINELQVADPNNPGQFLRDPADSTKFLKGYTWHHNVNMRTMDLVATDLHGNISPHQGGASWARNARW